MTMRYLAYQPASILKRGIALFIDITPIYLVLLLICSKALHIAPRATIYDSPAAQKQILLGSLGINILTMLFWIIYCMIAESSSWRGTFGKKFMNIRVSSQNRDRLTLKAILIRNTSKILSWLPFYLGFITAIFTHGNRGWHDILSKTCVTNRH